LYTSLGSNNEERCFTYRELFRNKIDDNLLHKIRESVNQDLVLGKDDFKDTIEIVLKERYAKASQEGHVSESVRGIIIYIRINWSLTPILYF